MPQAAHALDSLPFDILCRILVFCHPKDLANILATGKALRAMDNPTTWSVLVRDRFALDGTHSKLEYIKLHKNSGLARPDMLEIAWNDGSHWSVGDDMRSRTGQSATLHSVCWFHVIYHFKSVPAGTYIPTITIRIEGGTHVLSTLADVAVNCRTSDQKVGETSVGQLFGTLAQGQQHSTAWQNITLDPIQLDSATRYHNVLLEMVETDAPWASGLQIAAFELVPSK